MYPAETAEETWFWQFLIPGEAIETIFSWIIVNYDNVVDADNDLRDIKQMLQISVFSPNE